MIKEIRVTYPVAGQQGMMMIKERVGMNGVRGIDFDPNFPGFVIHKFSAVDGSMRQTYLNLATSMWFEYDKEKEEIEVDTDAGC